MFSSSVEYAIMIPNELEEDLLENLIKVDDYISASKNWRVRRTKKTNSLWKMGLQGLIHVDPGGYLWKLL